MIREISNGLEVPKEDICVVGSGRIGFSLSPDNFGTPYSQYSDLDIVVVSSVLFDQSWLDIVGKRHGQWSSLSWAVRDNVRGHRERHHIFNGWIYPESVAEVLKVGEKWITTFNGLSRIPYLSSRPIGARLYRTWAHATIYHLWSLGKLRQKVVGSTD